VSVEERIIPSPRYGESLASGRRRMGLEVDDVHRELNITPDMIAKIEASSVQGLPPKTFMQGYLRAYARLVEADVDAVLDAFHHALPQESEHELRARSNLPKETDLHSPVMRSLTLVLLLSTILTAVYGIYSYYSEKMQRYEGDSTVAGNRLAVPAADGIEVRQDAVMTDDDQLLVGIEAEAEANAADESDSEQDAASHLRLPELDAAGGAEAEPVEPEPAQPVTHDADRLTLYADRDSWVEITDADGRRLHYNLVKEGSELAVTGTAPFSLFLGNAPHVTMRLNDVDIKVNNFIRANNTAQFRVSTEDGRAVFHKR
jgi:cytoskeleton protein RodZ